ncbi:MAG: NADH-quinone oxidoreductase subunit N [Melioribacteraceae bacterium]|nr:NADH-quinone oxidoreductase subunit N [Melioribacteraceae bacterium]
MELVNIFEGLTYLKPEITLGIGLLLIVLLDLFINKNKNVLHFISLAIILITGYFVLEQSDVSKAFLPISTQTDRNFGMLTLDAFGIYFKILVLLGSILLVFFSITSAEVKSVNNRLGEYYALILGMLLGMMLMISASDLIMVYLSIELVSLSSYVLAGFTKLRSRSSEAALKYLLYGGTASGIMLFGISLLFGITGNTNLYEIHKVLISAQVNSLTFSTAIVMIFTGMAYKISAAPFHFWTPDVYEGAPISITAYLSVASKAAGFALLIRFVKTVFVMFSEQNGDWNLIPIFDWQTFIIVISILTMTLGNFTALWQNNLKRLLAYSSIAHAGYLLLGLTVLSDKGILAILIYFTFYLIMNLGAFYIVMLIADKTGTEDITKLKGLGHSSPFLGTALTIFLISLVGLPPTAGFIGKFYIFVSLLDSKMILVAVIALLNTVVSLYYYIKVLKYIYLVKGDKIETIPINYSNYIVIITLLIPTILFGIYFTPIVNLANKCVLLLNNL